MTVTPSPSAKRTRIAIRHIHLALTMTYPIPHSIHDAAGDYCHDAPPTLPSFSMRTRAFRRLLYELCPPCLALTSSLGISCGALAYYYCAEIAGAPARPPHPLMRVNNIPLFLKRRYFIYKIHSLARSWGGRRAHIKLTPRTWRWVRAREKSNVYRGAREARGVCAARMWWRRVEW